MSVPRWRTCLLLAAAVSALALGTSRSVAVEIIGHRGASYDAPENTLSSFRLAWEQRADAAETDVFLSKDGEIVVIHDSDTKRLSGKSGRVADQTLAQLKQLDVGRWKGEKWEGERIPTLGELLSTIPKGKRLFIEIKCGPEIAPRLTQVVHASRKRPEQMCLISLSYNVTKRVKQELPAIKCYWVVAFKRVGESRVGESRRWAPSVDEIIRKAKAAGLDGVDLENKPVVDREFVAQIKRNKLEVYTWTVDSLKEASRLEQAGIDGITTNRPGLLKEHFGGRP